MYLVHNPYIYGPNTHINGTKVSLSDFVSLHDASLAVSLISKLVICCLLIVIQDQDNHMVAICFFFTVESVK